MLFRTILPNLILFGLSAPFVGAQQTPTPAKTPDFPVVLQQNVVAGKTPVGTKVQAKLTIATLLNGTVIPRNATLAGEVTESVPKTATDPSRLVIRLDSVRWKDGSSAVKLYFTGSYYPTLDEPGQDLQYGPPQPASRTWNGQGEYPAANSKVYRPFPSGDSDKDSAAPDTPSSVPAKNSLVIKDIEVERRADGTIALTSKRSNIKLDHYTIYVVGVGETLPQK